MEEYNIEIWKDVAGYEGIYKISNKGRMKSLDRYVTRSDGVVQFKKGKMLEPITNTDGYYQIKLCRDGSYVAKRVHQIVADNFVDKPDDSDNIVYEINHIDCNRKNNCADNLEWVTHQDNISHSREIGRYKIRDFNGRNNPNYGNHILSVFYAENPDIAKEKLSRPASQNGNATKIELYDIDNNYIKTFDWIGGCAEYLIENGYTKSKVYLIRNSISKSIRENKPYLKHYFKKVS